MFNVNILFSDEFGINENAQLMNIQRIFTVCVYKWPGYIINNLCKSFYYITIPLQASSNIHMCTCNLKVLKQIFNFTKY